MKLKNIKLNFGGLLLLMMVIVTVTSCHKSSSTGATGTFLFHIHSNIDTNEVDDTTALYKDATGRHFGLKEAAYIISGVTLKNADGSTYSFTGVKLLKTIDSEEYVIGNAPIGVYTSVTFNVGAPASMVQSQTLTLFNGMLSNAGMFYSAGSGDFMNMKLQGFADTTTGQTGINPVPFLYEIGGDATVQTVTMPTRGTAEFPTNYVLTSGGTQYIHLICDYGKLLANINFRTQDSTNGAVVNPMIGSSIESNIPNFFRYEE